jgi:hypothetical protein
MAATWAAKVLLAAMSGANLDDMPCVLLVSLLELLK